MKLQSITSQSFINTKHYKPFYFFNTESTLNKLDKDTMIKINGVTHYFYNGKNVPPKATPVNIEVEDILIEDTLKINSEEFVIEDELIFN